MATLLFTAPTTELQAVNLMLESIGESPVSSLADAGLGDVAIAKDILGRANREVQAKGWHWNRDYEYSMARDVDSKIPVGSSILEIDSDGSSASLDVVVRGGFLWDRGNKRYTFDAAITCSVTWLLEFESIPEAARNYIAVLASRRFAKAALGTEEASRLSVEDEISAWASLVNNEARTGDANFLNDNYSAASILARGPTETW